LFNCSLETPDSQRCCHRSLGAMSFGSDSRLDQLLQDEKALLFRALEEHMDRSHLRMSQSIRALVANSTQQEESQEETHQGDYELAGAHNSDMSAASLCYASEVLTERVSLQGESGDHEIQNYDAQNYGLPRDEREACVMCMEQSMDSSGQEIMKDNLPKPSPKLLKNQNSFCPITSAGRMELSSATEELGTRNLMTLKDFFQPFHDDHSVSRLRKFVEGSTFDVITSIMVSLCCAMMAVESQYDGLQAEYVLNNDDFTKPASQVWPHAKMVLLVSDLFFNTLFTIELVIRLVALRKDACRSCWFYFDAILVVSSWLSQFRTAAVAINPMLLRLARLARLGRVIKFMRNAQVLQTLFILVRSIQASIGCLFWSFSILWFFQIVMAILMSQLLLPLMLDESRSIESRREVFKYFGTFVRGSLTMFEITMANWTPVCRLLYEDVHEGFAVLVVAYRCCFMFAIIRVITAVFVAETTRCVNSDDELAVRKKQKQRDLYCTKLKDTFKHLDIDGDGIISWDEFEPLITNPNLKTWLDTLDIDTYDLMTLFKIYDRGDGQFNIDRFIEGMSHVKGPAKSIDVLKLLANIDVVNRKMDSILQNS